MKSSPGRRGRVGSCFCHKERVALLTLITEEEEIQRCCGYISVIYLFVSF